MLGVMIQGATLNTTLSVKMGVSGSPCENIGEAAEPTRIDLLTQKERHLNSQSYWTDGFQQTDADVDEPIEVSVRKLEALHVKLHLRHASHVRHLLGQDLTG